MSRGEMDVPADIDLASLLARVDEVGDCLIWNCYALDGLHPQWRVGGRLWNVRRLLWLLVRGPLAAGLQVGAGCDVDLCVHPDHLAARTRSQACAGKPKTAAHRVRIALAKRADSTLTADIVQAVRMSAEPSVVLDEQLGLSRGYASKLRTGAVWRQHGCAFGGLGERAAS